MGVDELKQYGLEEMDADEITGFIGRNSTGVLALPDSDVPYLVPMGYSYDGDDSLYFTYFVGDWSRKKERTEQYGRARFLVYDADSMFNWESVSLVGSLNEVSEEEVDDSALENAWQQAAFQKNDEVSLKLFRFEVEEQEGFRYEGAPPGYE